MWITKYGIVYLFLTSHSFECSKCGFMICSNISSLNQLLYHTAPAHVRALSNVYCLKFLINFLQSFQVYQIYGRSSPEVVHSVLKGVGATHIILEDSICMAPPNTKHPLCRLTDIVDLHYGHVSVCVLDFNV